MKSTIFEARPLVAQSLMQRLLGQHPAQNAIIELNNLLATQPIETIVAADLVAIEDKYGFQLNQYQLNLEEFYAVHLSYRLASPQLRLKELSDVSYLGTLLQLSNSLIAQLHNQIGKGVYRHRVEQVIQRGYIEETDKVALAELRQWLALPIELADKIYDDACQYRFNEFVQVLGTNARLSPDNIQQLQTVSQGLGIRPNAEMKRTIERYRSYWAIEYTPLPVIDISISLQKAEYCYFQAEGVEWYEERVTVRRTNYADHYELHKSLKAVNLNSNKVFIQEDTFDIIKRVYKGDLYLTNKRFLFKNSEKVITIKMEVIVSIKTYKEGLLIRKATGKDVILLMKNKPDVLALVYQKIKTDIT